MVNKLTTRPRRHEGVTSAAHEPKRTNITSPSSQASSLRGKGTIIPRLPSSSPPFGYKGSLRSYAPSLVSGARIGSSDSFLSSRNLR